MKTEMYLFQFLRAGKSMIKVTADSMSGEGLFPYSHSVLTWQKGRGALGVLLYKGTSPINEDSALMTHSLPKGPTSNYHHTQG